MQSAVTSHASGETYDPEAGSIDLQGFAYSGGGRAVTQVEVSVDGGATWHAASPSRVENQDAGRVWAWALWQVSVALPTATSADGQSTPAAALDVVVRAVDSAGDAQAPTATGLFCFFLSFFFCLPASALTTTLY